MLVWTHFGLLQFLGIGQGLKAAAGLRPTKVNSAKVMVHNSMRARYVLPAMDYSLESDVEVGVVNSPYNQSVNTRNPQKIVDAYADPNTMLYGKMFMKILGTRPAIRGPSKIRVIGPMPPGFSNLRRDVVMKIYGIARPLQHLRFFSR